MALGGRPAAAFAGLVYLVSPGLVAPDPLGTVLMVIAGLCWAAYTLLGRIVRADNEKLAIHFMSFNFGIFCNKLMDVYGPVSSVSKEEEVLFGAQCFARAIMPCAQQSM